MPRQGKEEADARDTGGRRTSTRWGRTSSRSAGIEREKGRGMGRMARRWMRESASGEGAEEGRTSSIVVSISVRRGDAARQQEEAEAWSGSATGSLISTIGAGSISRSEPKTALQILRHSATKPEIQHSATVMDESRPASLLHASRLPSTLDRANDTLTVGIPPLLPLLSEPQP